LDWACGHAAAAVNTTIAVFTKNLTNPAYEAFQIGAEGALAQRLRIR
jgi:hypothetical protein